MGLDLEYKDGQTLLSEEEKEGLLITSITKRSELDEFEQLNIEAAIQWTYKKKLTPEKLLSEDFIKLLHKRMYGDIWSWAGDYRTTEKNLGISFFKIPTETRKLFGDVIFWIKHTTYPPSEIAVRFKHRLVSIHCFPNGNGRHSRLMADLILEKIYDQKFFTWGGSLLVKNDTKRKVYIKSIKAADNGSLDSLISFAYS